jgi:Zinc dependent phospholipase C
MPTPFMHLAVADAMLAAPSLPENLRERFAAHLPEFRLGHTAPDAQTVSGQTRQATHFFTVPMTNTRPAHEVMFAKNPELAQPAALEPARAAFLTGYICHLALDQLWIREIFEPTFGLTARWENFRERLYLHNVLRTYLDQDDLPRLNGMGHSLRAARPDGWLPFLADDALRGWRDLLAEQLQPGGTTRTLDIFAQRMKRDPGEIAALLNSPAELDRRIFSHLPAERLVAFRAEGLARCLALAEAYWES